MTRQEKIRRILDPAVTAVFGISTSNPFHPANVIYTKNVLHYDTHTYGINPKGGRFCGKPIYKDIRDLPEAVDLAVLGIRSEMIPDTLEQCIEAGAKGAIIISGGFAEIGRLDLKERTEAIAREHDFPIIGPNCLGIFAPPKLNTFFLPDERLVQTRGGSVGLISQSGGVLIDLILDLGAQGVGISRAVSTGNKDVIDEVDLLQCFKEDPKTKVLGIYMEGFNEGRGRDFVEQARDLGKPVVVLKAGRTPGGSKAVSSHTASLAGDYRVFHDVMEQHGILVTPTPASFISTVAGLSHYEPTKKKNVVILSVSGGHGAITADFCHDAGLNIVEVPEEDKAELRKRLGPSVRDIASLHNPIDLTGSTTDHDITEAADFFLQKDYCDCLITLLVPYAPGISSDVGARVSMTARETQTPVMVYIPHAEKYRMYMDGFEMNGIPVTHTLHGVVTMAESLMKG